MGGASDVERWCEANRAGVLGSGGFSGRVGGGSSASDSWRLPPA
jgi:hypothetical protein